MSKIFYIDLFSGAGGTTTGIHMVGENVKVLACVNHDTNAIESHKANHPECLHFMEDIRDWKVVVALSKLVKKTRRENPGCIISLWASLECTNYSKAKGGLPRDADSRTLANALFMYLEELKPEYVDIENVREFMSWGPLDEKGRPLSKLNGLDYLRWIKKMKNYGYIYDWQFLNAADFGAYTSRERYFGQFAKKGMPIMWPEPTHTRKPINGGLFPNLKKWRPVHDVLDLNDEGTSIFTRKKPLSENTLKRIYAGLVKFVAGGDDQFIQKYFSGRPAGKVISVHGPAGVVTTVGNQTPIFIKRYNGGNPKEKVKSVDQLIGPISINNRHAVVKPCFLTAYYSSGKNIHSIEKPCPTVLTKDRFTKVQPKFMTSYYSSGGQINDINQPNPTLTGIPKQRLTSVLFMDQQFGQSKPHSIERPAGTITGNPKQNLVSAKPWLMDTNYNNVGSSLNKPAPVITANHKYHYLVNTYKHRFFAIPFFDLENETMKKIRLFMAIHAIIDIKMRMLKIPELLKIQGFPKNYKLKGTKTEQKKYIGNAVVPVVAKAIVKAKTNALHKIFQKAI
jgi:DNA (cytosine-5)-methyltransferase 1